MTDPSLREKFAKIQEEQEAIKEGQKAAQRAPALEAADKFLNKLADNFVAELEEKVANGDTQPIKDHEAYGPCVVFKDASLLNVTKGEVQAMEGYKRLKETCRSPDVDLCLGKPQWGQWYDSRGMEFKEVRVYVSKSYSESEEALWDGAAAKAGSGKKRGHIFHRRHRH